MFLEKVNTTVRTAATTTKATRALGLVFDHQSPMANNGKLNINAF